MPHSVSAAVMRSDWVVSSGFSINDAWTTIYRRSEGWWNSAPLRSGHMPANAAITTIGDDTPGRNEAPTSNRSDSSGIINPRSLQCPSAVHMTTMTDPSHPHADRSLRVVAESLQNIEAQLSQLSRKTSDLQARLVASQYDFRLHLAACGAMPQVHSTATAQQTIVPPSDVRDCGNEHLWPKERSLPSSFERGRQRRRLSEIIRDATNLIETQDCAQDIESHENTGATKRANIDNDLSSETYQHTSVEREAASTPRCPFASMTSTKPRDHPHQKGLPTPPPTKDPPDPIAADITARRNSSPPPSVTGSASKCPIRFLDQHSPEEVAEYFERHKHEIPRSHEVCVRRYQSNAQSIRELDSKYGDLVHMIQGLGLKHQPLLPENGDGEGAGQQVEDDHNGQERVQKWADDVGESDEDDGTADVESEDMRPALGSPLREVRVGESPSRPWGIPYPTADDDDDDDVEKASRRRASRSSRSSRIRLPQVVLRSSRGVRPSKSREALRRRSPNSSSSPKVEAERTSRSERESPNKPAGSERRKKLKGSGLTPGGSTTPHMIFSEEKTNGKATDGRSEGGPRMVFTGPVFIGYPVEDAIRIGKELGKQDHE